MNMTDIIPGAALGVSVVVIVYSTLCLSLGLLLVYLLWSQARQLSYIFMLSILVCISTAVSITQQIHFAINWRSVKASSYALRGQPGANSGALISNGAVGLSLALFWIRFYIYSASALLVLFWAVVHFCGVWRIQPELYWLGSLSNHIEMCSKIFALLFPGVLFGIAQIDAISNNRIAFALICNIPLTASLAIGVVVVGLTLYKFIKTHRLLNGCSDDRTKSSTVVRSAAEQHTHQVKQIQRAIDRAIIIRFTITFAILALFEVSDVLFQVLSFIHAQASPDPQPDDYSVSGAIGNVVTFIPGVTSSLAAWAVWGTTRRHLEHTRYILYTCVGGGRYPSFGRWGMNGNEVGREVELDENASSNKSGRRENFERLGSGKDGGCEMSTKHESEMSNSQNGKHRRIDTGSTILDTISESDEALK